MKLTSDRYASPHERDHAYSAAEAKYLVSSSLSSGTPVDGVDDLHRELMSNRQDDALAAVENGDWLLVRDEAYYFDWGRFDKAAQEQKSAQRVKEISSKPLPEEKVEKLVVRILDSITGEPLANRKARFMTGQENNVRKTDGLGVAYLSPAPPGHLLAALQLHLVE